MTVTKLIEIIAWVDQAWVLLVLISIFKAPRALYQPMRYLVLYLGFVGCIELLSKLYLYEWLSGSNLHLLHIYTAGEFVILSLLYLSIFNAKQVNTKVLRWYLLVALLAILIYSAYHLWQGGNISAHFELYSKLLVSGTFISLSIWLFAQILKNPGQYISHFKGLAYLNSAVLLYFAGSFIIYLILNHLITAHLSDTRYLWLINALVALTFHLICGVALWQKDSYLTKTSTTG